MKFHLNLLLNNATVYKLKNTRTVRFWKCVVSILGPLCDIYFHYSHSLTKQFKWFVVGMLVPCALIFIPEFRESRCSKKVIAYTKTRRIDAQFRWSPPAFIKHSRLIGEFYTVCYKHATGMFFVTFFSFLLFWECTILNRYQIISVFSSNDWNEDSNSS